MEAPITLLRWSPRERVLAVVMGSVAAIVDADHPSAPLLRFTLDATPAIARWDDGGLDLAVCSGAGVGAFTYLRKGARSKADVAPLASKNPCVAPPRPGDPTPIEEARDAPEMRDRDLGPHTLSGGWKLADGRYLTRDLMLVRRPEPLSEATLAFRGKDSLGATDPRGELASVSAVVRSGELVAWQVGDEVRIYRANGGRRVLARKANLLTRCQDGRFAAWVSEGAIYRVVDVESGGTIGTAPREPGIVIGIDARCTALYTERIDGTIFALALGSESEPASTRASHARPIAKADGYVFEVRPSAARGSVGAGLWIAVSSGAVARIDDATGTVRVVAYATPIATAIGDGPKPGELALADASGVSVVRPSGDAVRVLPNEGADWEDLATAPDGATLLLAGADKVAILDLELREIVGTMPMDRRGRFAPWDDKGSVLAWSMSHVGGADGDVVPRSDDLVRTIAASVSNLDVEEGRLVLRRR
jgi:hypothetical protein